MRYRVTLIKESKDIRSPPMMSKAAWERSRVLSGPFAYNPRVPAGRGPWRWNSGPGKGNARPEAGPIQERPQNPGAAPGGAAAAPRPRG